MHENGDSEYVAAIWFFLSLMNILLLIFLPNKKKYKKTSSACLPGYKKMDFPNSKTCKRRAGII